MVYLAGAIGSRGSGFLCYTRSQYGTPICQDV